MRWLTPLVVLALAVAAGPLAAQQAPPFDTYRATIDTNLRLYTDPVIQAELKLTGEQKAKLARLPDDLLAKHKEAIEKAKEEDKQAAEKAAADRAELQKQLDALIEKHLSADQRKRLGQMATRAMGMTALRNEDVIKALALTADDQARLAEMQAAHVERLQKEFPNRLSGPGQPAAERQKYLEASWRMAQEAIAGFMATLSAGQQQTWKDFTGEPWAGAGFTPTTGGPRGRLMFTPPTQGYWLVPLLTNEKALAELKVEKAAATALSDGLTALQGQAGGRDIGAAGRFNSVPTLLAGEAGTAGRQLLTGPQAKRLEQIEFQIRGTGVFSPIGFVTTTFTATGGSTSGGRGSTENPLTNLKLTPAQVVKIDAVLADAAANRRGWLPRAGFGTFGRTETEEQKKARLDAQRKQIAIDSGAIIDILATFDVGQKAAWREFTGEPIDLTKLTESPTARPPFGGGGPFGQPQSIVTLWTREASQRLSRGEYAAALALYDEAIRLAPTNTTYVQQKASLLASCPSEWVRDGKQAVELMKKLIAERKEPAPGPYHVLAAAYAEAGQFDDAVKAQEKAIALLPKDDPDNMRFGGTAFGAQLKPQYEARLKLYQEKKPFRTELPKAKTPTPTGTDR